MNQEYAKKHRIVLQKLRWPITPRNVDGTENQAGKITHFTWIQTEINGRKYLERLLVSNIGTSDIIFGLPWFKECNPLIDWNTGKFRILKDKTKLSKIYREKLTRRIRDLRNLEIATVQAKSTDVPPPSPKKRTRKQIEKSIDPLSHPLTKESKMRRSDSLNWRERFKETEKRETKQTKTPRTIIEEEIDEDQWKTHTLNPTDIHETAIVSQIENQDEQEDDLLISYIKHDDPNEVWIKAKTNLAMDLAIEESAKRKEQTLDEMIPQELIMYRSVFDKIAANRFPDRRPWDHAIDLQPDFIPKKGTCLPAIITRTGKT